MNLDEKMNFLKKINEFIRTRRRSRTLTLLNASTLGGERVVCAFVACERVPEEVP